MSSIDLVALSDELVSLLPSGASLSESLRARLQDLARASPSVFVAFVTTPREANHDDHARGHAADLLADVGAVECIPALLETIADWDCPDILWSYLRKALPRFGAAIIEPALALLNSPRESMARRWVCDVLVTQGTRDSRIFDALCDCFAHDPTSADLFVRYGDACALPFLRDAILSFAPDVTQVEMVEAIDEMERAFVKLGGEIDDAMRERIDHWKCQATASHVAFARTRPRFPMQIDDDAAFRKAYRENMPSLDVVRYAKPLLALVPCWDEEAMARAVDVAETLERIALVGDGPERDAALARVLGRVDDAAIRETIADMIPRYDAMFPGRRANTRYPTGLS